MPFLRYGSLGEIWTEESKRGVGFLQIHRKRIDTHSHGKHWCDELLDGIR